MLDRQFILFISDAYIPKRMLDLAAAGLKATGKTQFGGGKICSVSIT
jgi:hypothetical protein